jgi:deoxycytidine triphosphate deaminase
MVSVLSGEDIAPLIRKVGNSDSMSQVQPAGYDLTVGRIFTYPEKEFILLKSKSSVVDHEDFKELTFSKDNLAILDKGAYLVEFDEITLIPENAVGVLLPKSTLLRNGLDLRTALFDPGYSGQPKAMLVCYRKATLERFSRLGQLVIIRNEKGYFAGYKGQYQNEGTKGHEQLAQSTGNLHKSFDK